MHPASAAIDAIVRAPRPGAGLRAASYPANTPIFISSNLSGLAQVIPVFGTLTLHFAPEPAPLALFGVAIASIAACGRVRSRP